MDHLIREYVRLALLEGPEDREKFAQDLSRQDVHVQLLKKADQENFIDDIDDVLAQGRIIKKLFAKYCDRSFMNSLVTTHWVSKLTSITATSRDELSCAATLPGNYTVGWQDGKTVVGVVVKGYVTLLANSMDDLYTGGGYRYVIQAPADRTRSSGANKGISYAIKPEDLTQRTSLVLDADDWDPDMYGDSIYNEALVDNWRIVSYVALAKEGYYQTLKLIEKGYTPEAPVMYLKEAKQRF